MKENDYKELKRLLLELKTKLLKTMLEIIEAWHDGANNRDTSMSDIEIYNVREMSDEEAKKEILRFMEGKKKEEIFASDIVVELHLDIEQVFRVN